MSLFSSVKAKLAASKLVGERSGIGFWKLVIAIALGVFIGGSLVLPTAILAVDLLLRITGAD